MKSEHNLSIKIGQYSAECNRRIHGECNVETSRPIANAMVQNQRWADTTDTAGTAGTAATAGTAGTAGAAGTADTAVPDR